MSKRFIGVVGICLGVFTTLIWQQVGQTAPALTALDYAEIQQLYARYAIGTDTGADDGVMWAETFTVDGVLAATNSPSPDYAPIRGYEELKAFAESSSPTPVHYATNVLIEPTADGAFGVAYHLGMVGGDRTPARALTDPPVPLTATYHDQLVKTPEGWRFKKRTITWGTFSDELLQVLEQ